MKLIIQKYNINIQRNGGEVVVGTISPYQYYYWKNKERELRDYLLVADKDAYEKEHRVPEEAEMLNWFEIDNVAHIYGAFIETDNYLHIKKFDQSSTSIKNTYSTYNLKDIDKLNIGTVDGEEINWASTKLENQFYFFATKFNKGIWTAERDLEIKSDLDLKRLNLHYKRIQGISICYAISYSDSKPMCLQDDSSGRSYGFSVHAGLQNNQTINKKLKKDIMRAEMETQKFAKIFSAKFKKN